MVFATHGKVYLAGPITGQSYGSATDWRAHAKSYLATYDIQTISPLRHKPYLSEEQLIKDSYENYPLSSRKGTTTRDRFDAMRADVLLANVLGAEKVSIGTVMEIAWADSKRIPIILVMDDKNIHDHGMLRECAGFIVGTLPDGLDIARAILT